MLVIIDVFTGDVVIMSATAYPVFNFFTSGQ
jgi:hypothetical protein